MTYNAPNYDGTNQPVTRYLQVLTRRRGVLVVALAAVLAAGTPFVLGLPSLYRSSATVLVESQVPEGFVQTAIGGELDNRLQSIKKEALSRGHLTKIIENFNLYSNLRERVPMEMLAARLEREIAIDSESGQVAGRPRTIAFTITYTGRDPETVASVANQMAAFYVSQNDTIRSRQVNRTTEVLQKQMEETKRRLDVQEARMQSYLSRHMGRLPQQVDANLLALGRLNGQLQFNAEQQSSLMQRRQELQTQLADLELTAVSASANAASADPELKLAAAKRELADLQSRFNDNYPDVRDKKAEIARLERDAVNANGSTATSSAFEAQRQTLLRSLQEVESRLDDLSAQGRSLRSQIGGYESRVESAPARGPEYDALARDYQSTRDAYDQLLRKYDEARLVENLEQNRTGEEFRILDAALPAPFASGPNRLRLLVLVMILAVLLGVGATLVVDRLDTSFHDVDELRTFTRVPVLASIPRIATVSDTRRRRARKLVLGGVTLGMLVLLAAGAFQFAHGSDALARLLLQVG